MKILFAIAILALTACGTADQDETPQHKVCTTEEAKNDVTCDFIFDE